MATEGEWIDPPAKSKRTHVKPAAIRELLISLHDFKNPDDTAPGKCRVCLEPVKAPRKFYCGDEHARAFQRIGFMTIQDAIHLRDKGVCQLCGLNEEAFLSERAEAGAVPTMLSEDLRRLSGQLTDVEADQKRLSNRADELRRKIALRMALEATLEAWRAPLNRTTLLDVDHKKPVEGWTGEAAEANHPDNLQLACVPCHRAKSATEAAGRARARRIRKKEGPKARRLRELREAQHATITETNS